MGKPRWKMGALLVPLCAFTCVTALTQVNQVENQPDAVQSKPHINELSPQNQGLNRNQIPGLTNVEAQETSFLSPEKKTVFKREAKKPKNTKRRVKYTKEKIEAEKREMNKAQSEPKPKKPEPEESFESETAPESDSSRKKSKKSGSSDTDSSDTESSDADSSDADSSDADSGSSGSGYSSDEEDGSVSGSAWSNEGSSVSTEEISLTSEAKDTSEITEEIYSGPDSSPPASSDSTDESSGSKAISGGSSEVSYTLSSSASVYSSSEEEYETEEKVGNSKAASKSEEKSKSDKSKSDKEGIKVKKTVSKKGDKIVTEVKIKLDKNTAAKKPLKMAVRRSMTTQRVLNMVRRVAKKNAMKENPSLLQGGSAHALKMMAESAEAVMGKLKVKKAESTKTRQENLEHDLERDYPSKTVEITNWDGTFAPMAGEPYVAPLHHQTKGGLGVENKNELLAKTKDKGKKDQKKKPKLSPKEKKKKKKEGKENPNNFARAPGKLKFSGKINADSHKADAAHVQPHVMSQLGNIVLQGKTIPDAVKIHAARKSGEILKTPSEEERESGTTYKPEGAYEYPSFRHPNFNPDTAYDENGIPIHESPGWTPPPTLPGDRRFNKERSRPGAAAGLSGQGHGPLARPQAAHAQKNSLHPLGGVHVDVKVAASKNILHPQDLHANLAAQEHQHAAESLGGGHVDHTLLLANNHLHNDMHPTDLHAQANNHLHSEMRLIDPHAQENNHLHNEMHLIDPHAQENNHLHNEMHLIDPHVQGTKDHPLEGHSLILPAQHQGGVQGEHINHNIQKREAAVSLSVASMESLSSVMTTQELNEAAKSFERAKTKKAPKTYVITDSAIMNKEDSAPMEALNPALFMYPNMLQAKQRPIKKDVPKLSNRVNHEQVVKLIANSPDIPDLLRKMGIKQLKMADTAMDLPQVPQVFNKDNEAKNPALYKHRNMFKVAPVANQGIIDKETLRRKAVEQLHSKRENKGIALEEFMRGGTTLKGRGRENFNQFFINQKKIFKVRTNKFVPTSVEHKICKREVEEAKNPALFSFQNLFSSNPKQVLPLKNTAAEKNERGVSPLSRFAILDGETVANSPDLHKILAGRTVPVIDAESGENAMDPQVKQYLGKKKEAFNPYLIQYPNMFAVNKSPNKQEELGKSAVPLNPIVKQYIGRKKENLNPYLYQYTNIFSADNKRRTDKVKFQTGDISPLFIASQKEKAEMIQEGGRPKRHIHESTEQRKTNLKKDLGLSRSGGTPGAGRPTDLLRKTADEGDSFASYFEGADPNVVEEEESTQKPERTTNTTGCNIGHPPPHARNRKQRKQASRRSKVLQTNAAILQKLTKEMRSKWRKELEDLNINLDNTDTKFTDSIQQEIQEAVEQRLLSGLPDANTIDELAHELYKRIETRGEQNKSTGLLVTGVQPAREPLVQGTLHVEPDKQQGKYHLHYWPLDEPGTEPRVLNGSINLTDLNLAHKNIASKILRKILTVKPRALSLNQANQVLQEIFTKVTSPSSVTLSSLSKSTTKRVQVGEERVKQEDDKGKPTGKITDTSKIPFDNQKMYVDLPQDLLADLKEMGIKNIETLKPMINNVFTSVTGKQTTFKPVSSEKIAKPRETVQSGEGEKIKLKEKTTQHVSEPVSTSSSLDEKLRILQETMLHSRNISFTLMKEMEARRIQKSLASMEDKTKLEEEPRPFTSWKLQQRLRDFKPQPYVTLPPFVRKWPTFRTQQSVELPTDALQMTTVGTFPFSTFLTMRPKYGGPRLQPFFFNDFKQIHTFYPTSLASSTKTQQTPVDDLKKGGGNVFEELIRKLSKSKLRLSAGLETVTSKPDSMTNSKIVFKSFSTKKPPKATERYTKPIKQRFSQPDFEKLEENRIEQTTRFEVSTSYWDDVIKKRNKLYQNDGKYRHMFSTRGSTYRYYGDGIVSLVPRRSTPTTFTTVTTTTTRRTGFHAVKHHVKTGFKKLFNIFRFGKSKSKEDEK